MRARHAQRILTGVLLTGIAASLLSAQGGATGTIRVVVTPAATILFDGRADNDGKPQPSREGPVAVGLHRIRIQHPAFQDWVREVSVTSQGTVQLVVDLNDRAARKSAASSSGSSGGWNSLATAVSDPDVKIGVESIKDGNFEAAITQLDVAVRLLANIGPKRNQQAIGYVFLAAALAELDQLELATRSLALARRIDPGLVPRPTDFSRRVLTCWSESQSLANVDSLDLAPFLATLRSAVTVTPSAVAEPPPTGEATVAPPPPPPGANTETSPADADFISINDAEKITSMDFVSAGAQRCRGTLQFLGTVRKVEWSSRDPGCSVAWSADYAELREPGVAPQGGILLRFRTERPPMVLIPLPDEYLLDPNVPKKTIDNLQDQTRVNLRLARRSIMNALNRTYVESPFGPLVDVNLDELLTSAADFGGAMVRTQGTLTVSRGAYALTDGQFAVRLDPTASTLALLRNKANDWNGAEMLVSGTFSRAAVVVANRGRTDTTTSDFALSISSIEPIEGLAAGGNARLVTADEIYHLVPDRKEQVKVVGRYRAYNQFGDLPNDTKRTDSDWVIKDGPSAIWVSGKPPAGKNFELDVTTSEQGPWLLVYGTIEARKGAYVLRANKVEQSPPPAEVARVTKTAERLKDPKLPPKIVHVIPTDKEDLETVSTISIQFDEPMDEASFEGRVLLRYAEGAPGTFRRMSLNYAPDRHFTLTVEPGIALQRGRTLELVLMPDIVDVDKQKLVGTETGSLVLRWKVRR